MKIIFHMFLSNIIFYTTYVNIIIIPVFVTPVTDDVTHILVSTLVPAILHLVVTLWDMFHYDL